MNDFICTFGLSQPLKNCYVVVPAETATEARNKMFAMYGRKWAFTYKNREEAGVYDYHLQEVPFGTPNEY